MAFYHVCVIPIILTHPKNVRMSQNCAQNHLESALEVLGQLMTGNPSNLTITGKFVKFT